MPRLRLSDGFGKAFRRLSAAHQAAVERSLAKFVADPARRGLNFESLAGQPTYYSIRAGAGFRVLLRRENDEQGDLFVAVDCGPHDIYRRMKRKQAQRSRFTIVALSRSFGPPIGDQFIY